MNITRAITEKLDLPLDAALNLSKIVITGNSEVLVGNYKGIAEYTPETVKLGTLSGMIRITGENMSIKSIGTEEITISGVIRNLELE